MTEHTTAGGGRVYVEVSGLTGSGKSAIMGEVEIALKALGLSVEHDADFQAEKNGTHADWQAALDLYRPTVVLTEKNVSRALQPAPAADGGVTADDVLRADVVLILLEYSFEGGVAADVADKIIALTAKAAPVGEDARIISEALFSHPEVMVVERDDPTAELSLSSLTDIVRAALGEA